MQETTMNTLTLWFASVCQAVGLDPTTVILSLAAAAASAASACGAWVAAKVAKRLAVMGWKTTVAVCRWAKPRPEPLGDVCQIVMGRLDSRTAKWESTPREAYGSWMTLVVPGCLELWFDSFATADGYLKGVKVQKADGCKIDALPLLTKIERKAVETKARQAVKRLAEENDAYTRMEVIDALSPVPPSHTVAGIGGIWDVN